VSYSGWGELTVPGEVTGYRAWRPVLGETVPALSAYTNDYRWQPGKNTASCNSGNYYALRKEHNNVSPDKACTCGFYARTEDDQHGYSLGIDGVIKASGRLILGQTGFRAEFARIVALYKNPLWDERIGRRSINEGYAENWDELLSATSERYAIPIFQSFKEASEAFPPEDLSAFRKEPSQPAMGDVLRVSQITITQLNAAGWPVSGSAVYVSGHMQINYDPTKRDIP